MSNLFRIRQRPNLVNSAQLLQGLLPYATLLGLVHDLPGREPSGLAADVLRRLGGHLVAEESVSVWPGSHKTGGGKARRFLFRYAPNSLDIFLGAAGGIFANIPNLLVDFHLMRADGSVVFGTTTSDRVAWLQLAGSELAEWRLETPRAITDLFSEAVRLQGQVEALGVLAGDRIGGTIDAAGIRRERGRLGGEIRTAAAEYLRRGLEVIPVPGDTRDVLGEAFEVQDGAAILSDGVYCWRRDAAEYVARYGTAIAAEAIKHFQSMNWSIPSLTAAEVDEISSYIWSYL